MSFRLLVGLIICLMNGFYMKTAAANEPVLTAQPGVCIVKNFNVDQCEMNLRLFWTSTNEETYCMYSSTQTDALRCWQGAQNGTHNFDFNSSQSIAFWLQRPLNKTHLSKIKVRIVSPK